MTDWTDRIDALEAAAAAFVESASRARAALGDRTPRFGTWSLADVLAHLIAWDAESVRRWREILGGDEEDVTYDVEAFNAKAVAARREASWAELVEEHRRAHGEMLALARELPARARADRNIREWIVALLNHYEEHARRLEEAGRLVGERVYLRRMEPEDLGHVHRWLSDEELCGLIGQAATSTRAEVDEWFSLASVDTARRWFVIVTTEGDRPIGEAGLLRIDERWRTTDMSIVIGERDAWGKGYGTEVGRILLDLAFDHLGLHRVAVGVVGFHEPAVRFWESLGFRREGVQRDGYLHEGKFHDFVMLSVLEDEWRGAAR